MYRLLFAVAMLVYVDAFAQTLQGTAFTYQGQLSQAGTPLDGNVDMVFDLFDAATGGNAVGPSLDFTTANGNPVPVHAGIFDATLDFGPLAFNGVTTDQRFLRVTVNSNALTPRTPIHNAPYALQSRTSELAYSVSDGSIGTTQIDAAQVQRRVGGTCASGSSVQSVNADGTVVCQSVGSGTISAVVAGSGLVGGGTTGSVRLSADTTTVQKRVTGTCAGGSAMNTIAADGTVTCQSGSSGDITAVIAGNGLSGGGTSGSVTLDIANPLNIAGTDANGVIVALNTAGNAVAIQGRSDAGVGVFGKTVSGRGVEGDSAAASSSGVSGINSSTTGIAYGVRGQTDSVSGLAVAGYANATSGTNAGVMGATTSGAGVGVRGSAMDSIGANLGGGVGVYGETASGTGVYGIGKRGVYGESTAGNGVVGQAVAGAAVVGKSTGSGPGVVGATSAVGLSLPSMCPPACGTGVIGYAAGAGEFAMFGQNSAGSAVVGSTLATVGGIGVWGRGDTIDAIGGGSGIGVFGQSTTGMGVYGKSDSKLGVWGSSNTNTGVRGDSSGSNGVEGHFNGSGAGSGVYGTSEYYGVQGFSATSIGIYGKTTTGRAGYFDGNVTVIGTLSKSAGSFQIDHPLDPANKYLYHSFVESPDMKNVYDGIATLDVHGEAWVEMPAYFEALNRDFRYQLTALDAPAPSLYVAARIADNRFRLAGGQAGQQVSWQVTGTRKDAYAEAHRIVPEVDKPVGERGKYLYPALFGQPETMTIVPATARAQAAPSPVPPTDSVPAVQP